MKFGGVGLTGVLGDRQGSIENFFQLIRRATVGFALGIYVAQPSHAEPFSYSGDDVLRSQQSLQVASRIGVGSHPFPLGDGRSPIDANKRNTELALSLARVRNCSFGDSAAMMSMASGAAGESTGAAWASALTRSSVRSISDRMI